MDTPIHTHLPMPDTQIEAVDEKKYRCLGPTPDDKELELEFRIRPESMDTGSPRVYKDVCIRHTSRKIAASKVRSGFDVRLQTRRKAEEKAAKYGFQITGEYNRSLRLLKVKTTAKVVREQCKTELYEYEKIDPATDGPQTFTDRKGILHLPAELHDVFHALFGLDQRPKFKTMHHRFHGTQEEFAAKSGTSFTPLEAAKRYNAPLEQAKYGKGAVDSSSASAAKMAASTRRPAQSTTKSKGWTRRTGSSAASMGQ